MSVLLAAAVLFPTVASTALAAPPDPLVDQPHYSDPVIEEPGSELSFHPRLKEVWSWALDQPSADTRRRAANAIADAYSRGNHDLKSLAGRLTIELDQSGQHPLVKLAAAKALMVLDAREAESSLVARNQADGMDTILLTDPALARWGAKGMRQAWIDRAINPSLDRAIRLSAIQSLATVKEAGAYAGLLKIVQDGGAEATLRAAAATAAAACRVENESSLAVAQRYMGGSTAERLLAARLLASEKSDGAIGVLTRLARDTEPSVAAASLRRLVKIDPATVEGLAETLLKNPDPNIRHLAVEGLASRRKAAGMKLMAAALDDVSGTVRQYARDQMILFDRDPALRGAVRAEVARVLGSKSWRGLEQAALILGQSGDEAACHRLLELMKHQRPEVRLAAAAALRWIDNPATLAPILAHATQITDTTPELTKIEGERMKGFAELVKQANAQIDQGRTDEMPPRIEPRMQVRAVADTDRELVQFFCFFAKRRYAPAEPLLMRYVPKHSQPYGEGRGAAIYALGYLYEGKNNPPLAAAFASRATDNNPLDPEVFAVRRFSLVSLGRMKDPSGLGAVRSIYGSDQESFSLRGAARWGLMNATGQVLPPFPPTKRVESGWWLEPMD